MTSVSTSGIGIAGGAASTGGAGGASWASAERPEDVSGTSAVWFRGAGSTEATWGVEKRGSQSAVSATR